MPVRTSPISSYGWNPVASRYIDTVTGRFVSRTAVMNDLETMMNAAQADMDSLTRRLVAGEINIPEWQLAMEREIKIVHTLAGAAARGGWAQMSQSDWGFVGSQIKKQYNWLAKFASDLKTGKQRMNGTAVQRAKLYAQSGRSTFEEMTRRMMKNKGKTEERRVLGENGQGKPVEHCETDGNLTGCIELAAKSWQPIGSLPPIGESPCFTNCRCHFEYR